MMANLRRQILVLILFTELVLLAGSAGQAAAQERTPIPEYTGDRVYIKDVPGSYQSLNETIKQLERSSPQSYFVVVVRSAGLGPDSATRYVDELSDRWSKQARAKGLKLDPERSVITLVAIDDRKVAVHPGSFLRERAGLRKDTVDTMIDQSFIPLAREGKYPEAVASLLARIEDQVAKQGTAVTAPAKNSLVAPAETGKSGTQVAVPAGKQAATQGGIQNQMLLALVASLLAVGLIVAALIWLARHRTRNTVESKIKQYKKNAVDVMDRLDALKARLKKLPVEDPDFKEPISGETLAVYQKIEGNLTGLWDRWLEVMDALDKAQALAKKDNALGTEKLKQAEKLVSDSKVFEQIEVEAQKCAGQHGSAQPGPRECSVGGRRRGRQPEGNPDRGREGGKRGVALGPLQAGDRRHRRPSLPGQRDSDARSDRGQTDPRQGPGTRPGTPGSRAPDSRPVRGWPQDIGGTDDARTAGGQLAQVGAPTR